MSSYHPSLEAAISRNIIALREKLFPGRGGQVAAARKVGIRDQQWNAIENGHRVPDPANLDKIAKAFGVPVESLWQEDAPAAPAAEASRGLVPVEFPVLATPPKDCPNQKACVSQAKLLKLLVGIAGMASWPQEERDAFVDEILLMMERTLKQHQESEPESKPSASAL